MKKISIKEIKSLKTSRIVSYIAIVIGIVLILISLPVGKLAAKNFHKHVQPDLDSGLPHHKNIVAKNTGNEEVNKELLRLSNTYIAMLNSSIDGFSNFIIPLFFNIVGLMLIVQGLSGLYYLKIINKLLNEG